MKKDKLTDSSKRRILDSTIAGTWYPGTARQLEDAIAEYLSKVPDGPKGEVPNILVLPHAGYAYSAQTAAYGIKRILGAGFKRVVVLAPTHRTYLENRLIAPEAEAVATPCGPIPVDHAAIEAMAKDVEIACSDAIHAKEHSTQIQYPMLQYALKDFKIVPLIVGTLDDQSLARAAQALRGVMDEETLLVVSSDFTHYGRDFDYTPFKGNVRDQVEQVDFGAFDCIQERNLEGFLAHVAKTGATICGRNPIAVMLKLLPQDARFERLHYETSSDASRDFSRFVCYMCIAGRAAWGQAKPSASEKDFLTDNDKQALLGMARRAIRYALDNHQAPPADFFAKEATENMRREMGCFVTLNLKPHHELRGCIGEIVARRPLYQAVTVLAVHSAFGDRRFSELRPSEFDAITIEISALTPEHPVASWRDIEIGRHGMTLSKNGCSAVFLPQVAPEQGWTLEETLSHLALKAGLGRDDWREGATFTVFEAIIFRETDFQRK